MANELWIYLLTIVGTAVLVIGGGVPLLKWLQEHGCRQYVRDDGPNQHLVKAGTPTMGGLLFVPAVLLVGLGVPLLVHRFDISLVLLVGVTLAFMALGWADDSLMLRRKGSLGLKARQKLAGQFLLAGLFLWLVSLTGYEHTIMRLPFSLIPIVLPGWVYYIFATLLVVGTSNSTNLTDGLDGLLGGLMTIAAVAFAVFAFWAHQPAIALFCCALAGGCLGFLFYNRHPAKVFMGDTGSLALGAALSGVAILLRMEPVLIIIGTVFFIEALSVILQVLFFKRTGRRIFKMSPLHHHFELSGWQETRVVKTFWVTAALITAIALVGTRIGWKI